MFDPEMLTAGATASLAPARTRQTANNTANSGHYPHSADKNIAIFHTGRPNKETRGGIPPQKKFAPEKVLQAFNTWAFKREQPDNPDLLLQTISESNWLARPLSFVLYWGKGPRSQIAEPEIACINYLASLARRVRDVYEPGAAFKLIYTDTHAELNGYSRRDICEYFDTVEAVARAQSFSSCWLGDLVRAAGDMGATDLNNETLSEDTLNRLSVCAAKWFRGEGSVKDGAAKYYQMNMIEKRAVQHAFPRSVFVTFNGSEFRDLFPDQLPIFYMYSLKRGVSVKPWFIETATTAPTAETVGQT